MSAEMHLYDVQTGHRLYLTADERDAFLEAAKTFDSEARTLCMTLAFSGCRVSEALALTVDRVDIKGRLLVFETLKKRKDGVWRAVPVPDELLDALNLVHGIHTKQERKNGGRGVRLWPVSRMTAWRRVAAVMAAANIQGPHATPKGLRHAFGVAAISSGAVSLNILQKWLGHGQITTTAIYAQAVGEEERDIMARMWGKG